MKIKKAFATMFVTFASVLLVAGCSSSDDNANKDGKKTVEFMHLWRREVLNSITKL